MLSPGEKKLKIHTCGIQQLRLLGNRHGHVQAAAAVSRLLWAPSQCENSWTHPFLPPSSVHLAHVCKLHCLCVLNTDMPSVAWTWSQVQRSAVLRESNTAHRTCAHGQKPVFSFAHKLVCLLSYHLARAFISSLCSALGYDQGDGLHFAEKEAESQEFLMASHGALSLILRRYHSKLYYSSSVHTVRDTRMSLSTWNYTYTHRYVWNTHQSGIPSVD